MTQNSVSPTLSRPAYRPVLATGGDTLDALLDSIMGDDPGPKEERVAVAAREEARERQEQRQAEEHRARQAERVADELRAQIHSIALQVQALSEATAHQAEQDHAIQELRQVMRQVVMAAHQQPKPAAPSFNAELQLPSLQIKLVLAQAANLLHQADKEVTVLANWSMLFGGVALGTLLSLLVPLAGPYTTRFWIYLAIAIFAFLVALVFAFLAQQARRRVANARKAMDESTLTRTVPVGGSWRCITKSSAPTHPAAPGFTTKAQSAQRSHVLPRPSCSLCRCGEYLLSLELLHQLRVQALDNRDHQPCGLVEVVTMEDGCVRVDVAHGHAHDQ